MSGELKALMLLEPRLTLAVAESMTCGRVQSAIGATSGASEFFLGGVTAYTLDEKVKLLEVDRSSAEDVNCVSAAVAGQMARGVCRLFGADFSVATTGYAERSPAWSVTEPMAWWAVARREAGGAFSVKAGRVEFPGATRIEAQTLVAEATLAALVAALRELREREG